MADMCKAKLRVPRQLVPLRQDGAFQEGTAPCARRALLSESRSRDPRSVRWAVNGMVRTARNFTRDSAENGIRLNAADIREREVIVALPPRLSTA
jgi:hypothetical protein